MWVCVGKTTVCASHIAERKSPVRGHGDIWGGFLFLNGRENSEGVCCRVLDVEIASE